MWYGVLCFWLHLQKAPTDLGDLERNSMVLLPQCVWIAAPLCQVPQHRSGAKLQSCFMSSYMRALAPVSVLPKQASQLRIPAASVTSVVKCACSCMRATQTSLVCSIIIRTVAESDHVCSGGCSTTTDASRPSRRNRQMDWHPHGTADVHGRRCPGPPTAAEC